MAKPLPAYVRDQQGRAHFRGSAEYDSILIEREGGQESAFAEMISRFETLLDRAEAATEGIERERTRLEEATAPLLERSQEPVEGGKGDGGATRG